MDRREKQEQERPFAYPKPTENDVQLSNQPEYVDQEPNRDTNEISDMAGPEKSEPESTDQKR